MECFMCEPKPEAEVAEPGTETEHFGVEVPLETDEEGLSKK
jgi:hypothetical protein